MKKSIQNPALFVFEGADGAGKTTLISALKKYFDKNNIKCETFSFPGRHEGSLGKLVYDIHHDPQQFGVSTISSTSLQLLHTAAHVDVVENAILPALHDGKVVLLDRYWWSIFVYGTKTDVPITSLESMISIETEAWMQVKPTKLFLIDRPGTNHTLASAYMELARCKMDFPVEVLHNTGTIDALLDKVLEAIRGKGDGCGLHSRQLSEVAYSKKSLSNKGKNITAFSDSYVKATPPKTSKVYDTYWRFTVERQKVFFRQVEGEKGPLSQDPILLKHKFTNAYRASDRVSQYLIRNVIYGSNDQTPQEVFFRTILFKLFNKIETWELLKNELGDVKYSNYSFELYNEVLTRALNKGSRIYSAAYIMPAARAFAKGPRKHASHLRLLEAMLKMNLPERLTEATSMREAFNLLRAFPMMGDFLAYQFVTDLNYSTLMNFSEQEFVIPGPGARDGIRKCFTDLGEFSEADVIKWVADRQDIEFERLGISFKNLWGRQLQLIDCQNLFCETDKYARLAHPDVVGLTGRTRIKQMYRPTPNPIEYWYPPKWEINEKVSQDMVSNVPFPKDLLE